ncbi:MAG: response regulator [Patescibacteria group bacterium]
MKKILLIEDEKILSEMYAQKLVQENFTVLTAFEPFGGLELARKEKPDLVLLDILLPNENGIYFLEQLSQDSKISNIPVVVFSNYDDIETKKLALNMGAKEYLLKTSYTPKQVIEKIIKYL